MDVDRLKFFQEQGYEEIHEVSGTIRGITRFLFTHGIVAELHEYGYERRWCYPTKQEAIDALNAWISSDDEEPDHWLRRTHIHDEYPEKFSIEKGHKMSDVINGRLIL
jgi:hypothetical protein